MFQGINVVSIPVSDLELARRFYGDTLGLGAPVYDLPEAGWIEFGCGGGAANLSVTTSETQRPGAKGATVVLNVGDCGDAVRELRARGVACEDPRVFPGFVTFAAFEDPFGNRLQICSPA
jgi:predicted enzyme related to lactoylglutathione lyase